MTLRDARGAEAPTVGARGNASDGLIHSFNRILIKGVDEHHNMCFRLDLPSKNVGLRVGLARFSLHYFVQNIASDLFWQQYSVGLKVGLARFSLAPVCWPRRSGPKRLGSTKHTDFKNSEKTIFSLIRLKSISLNF